MNAELGELLEKAEQAVELAHAPYSKYRVGAAVLTEKGMFEGANIENASSNLGVCAERVAIAHALMHEAKEIKAVAVFCASAKAENDTVIDAQETMPCGGCRQWLAELAPEALIVTNGIKEVFQVRDLLPRAFKLPESFDLKADDKSS